VEFYSFPIIFIEITQTEKDKWNELKEQKDFTYGLGEFNQGLKT